MRISFLTGHLPVNGSIRRTIEMANELVHRGHKVVIYSLDTQCAWLQCNAEIRPQEQVISDTHDVLIFNKVSKSQEQLMEQAEAKYKLFYVVGIGKTILKQQLAIDEDSILKQCLGYTILTNGTWMHDFLQELGIKSHVVLSGVNTDMFYPVCNHEENILYHIKFDTTTKGIVDAWEEDIKKFKEKTKRIWGDKFIGIISIEVSSQEDMQTWWEKEYGGSIH